MFQRRKTRDLSRRGVVRFYQLLIFIILLSASVWYLSNEFLGTHPPQVHAVQHQEAVRLYGAMQLFSEKFGRFPPNFDDKRRVARFVIKAFPEYKPGVSTPYPESLDAAEALVFWLNEISTDPADPFAKNAVDRFQFYTFSEPQLRDGRYYPHAPVDAAPFVYFEWQTYETAKYEDLRPYVRSQWNGRNQYFAPETCQIVVAGEDGKFGRGGSISQLSDEDRDNAVSFTTQRVGDIDPNE